MNFIESITAHYDSLSRSEKKVADVVLQNPQLAMASSIATLAKAAAVSEPSVHRFCQKLDTKGFPDFKIHLAQCIGKGMPAEKVHLDQNDTTENFTKKIFEASIASLTEARNSLDIVVVKRCIDILSCAKRITCCGLGASATVAHDMMNKFFCLNIPCNYFEDSVMMLTSASNATIEDVFILISHTGKTKDIIEVARLARDRQATVIGFTPKTAPLAKECNLVLSIKTPDDMEVWLPTASRIAQLTLVDILATGIILRKGPQFLASIQKLKKTIRESRSRFSENTENTEQETIE